MILKTERLRLRPLCETDAESLYEYAKDPLVGPIAGWPVHSSVEYSRQVIKDVLSSDTTFAVVLNESDKAIGSIGLMLGKQSNLVIGDKEAELGYWIGVPYWGRGLIPEAVRALMHYAFEELELSTLWCGYFDGNEKSKRVQEKCGFQYHHTEANKEWPLMQDRRTEHISHLKKEQWLSTYR